MSSKVGRGSPDTEESPIIGVLVESRFVVEKNYLVLDKVRSEFRPKQQKGCPKLRRVLLLVLSLKAGIL